MFMSHKFMQLRHGIPISRPEDYVQGPTWSQRPPRLPRFTCGFSPFTISKVLAFIDIIKNIAGVALVAYILSDKHHVEEFATVSKDKDVENFLELNIGYQVLSLLALILIFVLALVFSVVQFQGLCQMDSRKLRIWFGFQLLTVLLLAGIHCWLFVIGMWIPGRPTGISGLLFLIFFPAYLWVAYHMYIISLVIKDMYFWHLETTHRRAFQVASDECL